MWVPGATSSGFLRPSAQGPRLEKKAMSLALLALESATPQEVLPEGSLPPFAVDIERTFSEAPTVMTFLAVPGAPTVCAPPEPALPAAKTMTISWFPETGKVEPLG